MNLELLTISQIREDLKAKKYSVVGLTEACLKQIKKLDSKLNAFITVCQKEALKSADWADKQIAKDKDAFRKYPLLGVPYAAKDLFCTKGIRTTAGSRLLEDFVPEYSATVVEKLENAGAVLLGKNNCDAWAHGSSTENSDFFTTKNPWNAKYLPGGSSGGSTAAVKAAQVPFTVGTETGGSIRQPSAWCGVTGLKPTYGAVSRYGVIAMASSLDSPGPMGKTVGDVETVFQLIRGKDVFDATSSNRGGYSMVRKKARIGLPKGYFGEGVEKDVAEAVMGAAHEFVKMGYNVEEVSLLDPKYAVAVYTVLQRSEVSSNLARYDGIRYGKGRDKFGAEAKKRIMLGTYALSSGYYDAYYEKAQKVRRLIVEDFAKVFQKVDVLLAPTTPVTALKIGAGEDKSMFGELMDILVEASTIAGLPGMNLPCGFDSKGLPIGMQLIGPQWSEELLFKLGEAFQKQTDFHLKSPKL